jgi:translocation and assembly module TamB
VEGRGLNAELKGRVHLTGTHKKVAAHGKLQLVSGEYIFSGKVFKLTQGEIIFNDKGTRNAYIALSGNCDLPEVNVTVMLEGPLTAPKLSFQSSPQMPTSSLLARILFNKDISEISAVQALQVAQTVISLSGNSGPDILEKIRRTIGIDRLTLITSENDPGKISLQIGKYLMRGVLLTLSQGAESRNVSVEVDLRKGIKFQAEFDEEQQGKFSLKWHHHY